MHVICASARLSKIFMNHNLADPALPHSYISIKGKSYKYYAPLFILVDTMLNFVPHLFLLRPPVPPSVLCPRLCRGLCCRHRSPSGAATCLHVPAALPRLHRLLCALSPQRPPLLPPPPLLLLCLCLCLHRFRLLRIGAYGPTGTVGRSTVSRCLPRRLLHPLPGTLSCCLPHPNVS
jgi:hypothetical protein